MKNSKVCLNATDILNNLAAAQPQSAMLTERHQEIETRMYELGSDLPYPLTLRFDTRRNTVRF